MQLFWINTLFWIRKTPFSKDLVRYEYCNVSRLAGKAREGVGRKWWWSGACNVFEEVNSGQWGLGKFLSLALQTELHATVIPLDASSGSVLGALPWDLPVGFDWPTSFTQVAQESCSHSVPSSLLLRCNFGFSSSKTLNKIQSKSKSSCPYQLCHLIKMQTNASSRTAVHPHACKP